jgi:hypothetical protein
MENPAKCLAAPARVSGEPAGAIENHAVAIGLSALSVMQPIFYSTNPKPFDHGNIF